MATPVDISLLVKNHLFLYPTALFWYSGSDTFAPNFNKKGLIFHFRTLSYAKNTLKQQKPGLRGYYGVKYQKVFEKVSKFQSCKVSKSQSWKVGKLESWKVEK